MRVALLACVAALTLSGCATRMTPAETSDLIRTLHEAGCGGTIVVDIRAGSGQLGGSGSAQFTANGSCAPGGAPVPPPEGGQ